MIKSAPPGLEAIHADLAIFSDRDLMPGPLQNYHQHAADTLFVINYENVRHGAGFVSDGYRSGGLYQFNPVYISTVNWQR